MVTGGNATVMISNMDAALKFYTEVLGMKVASHYGDDWATVEAGGFTVGLHPASPDHPGPGSHGSILVGLMVDDIDAAHEKLVAGGARNIGPAIKGEGGAFIHFNDLDGNSLYLWKM